MAGFLLRFAGASAALGVRSFHAERVAGFARILAMRGRRLGSCLRQGKGEQT